MSELNRAVATLRLRGDELIPDEVTALLGAAPTGCKKKGDLRRLPDGGTWTETFGQWRLKASETTPGDVDTQVAQILGQLTHDLEIWRALSARYEIDLFCGFFMAKWNEGVDISATTLQALGERGIKLDIDLYAPSLEG